jgi:hypothetical protein
MIVIYNSIIPFKGFRCINLFGILFARKGMTIYKHTVVHESIHTAQIKEMLYVFFYLWYFVEWLVKLCYFRDSKVAYHYISFECEAFRHQHDDDYLPRRKHFTWLKYIRKQA